jgi:transcriptional regulator with PAS, ATPase and Fis domain
VVCSERESCTRCRNFLNFTDIIGESNIIKEIIRIASRASENEGTVLLEGESGTGKEIFAQAIHNRSQRKRGPFIAVNCGAIPRELVGSELFGYIEGAFTGAARGGRPGKFELASHGTIFLDEIGDMPLAQQVSLLRVLQERSIIRIGDNKEIPVDVRVICASNKSLFHEVQKGNFRQDLYYRLNVISIKIPPLREREEDIELLFRHFVRTMGHKSGYDIKEIDSKIFRYLLEYPWPGNVRELQNVVERMMNFSTSNILTVGNLPEEIIRGVTYNNEEREKTEPAKIREAAPQISIDEVRARKKQNLEEEDRVIIQNLLLKYNGNITHVANALNSSRNTIYRKIRKYEIKI